VNYKPRRILLTLLLALLLISGEAHGYPFDHLKTTDDIGLVKVPHNGTSHILVIPSRVNLNEFPEDRWQQLERFFKKEGGTDTFREYWQIVSGGRYDPIPTLVQPVLYPTACPIPGKAVDSCTITINDVVVLAQKGLQHAITDILRRVRDEQGIDLSTFDVNSAAGPSPDGFFDGVIIDTDIYNGITFPLSTFGNTVTVGATMTGDPKELTLGVVSLVPPDNHEFAHLFGFIDLYGGPAVNGLMGGDKGGLCAFSRQQIGWGEVEEVTKAVTVDLHPVLDGGKILRIGQAPRYVLVENRGGPNHAKVEAYPPGVYIYSVDESTLPETTFGFIDGEAKDLYLPNKKAPYLTVNLPIGCGLPSGSSKPCAVKEGEERAIAHASGEWLGFAVTAGKPAADGTITLTISEKAQPPDGGLPDASVADAPGADAGQPSPPASGCAITAPADASSPWDTLGLLCLFLGLWLPRRRSIRRGSQR
jgi:hypothetical protein